MTPLAAAAAREVTELHALFVELFTRRSRDFSRCEAAFSPKLEMVTPEGRLVGRNQIIQALKGAMARADFRITIHEIAPLREDAGSVLLRYIEEQYRDGETTRRMSIALFETASDAPLGVAWRYLQETWIEN
jgi:hypothetical protein